MSTENKIKEALARVEKGGAAKYHQKNAETGKLFARERIARLVDPGSFVEDAALANVGDPELPADGVITGTATVAGRRVALMANDSTVKAGSWGRRTVEKILRIQESAQDARLPSSTSSTAPGRASPTRSRCSRAAAAPGASSTTRSR